MGKRAQEQFHLYEFLTPFSEFEQFKGRIAKVENKKMVHIFICVELLLENAAMKARGGWKNKKEKNEW